MNPVIRYAFAALLLLGSTFSYAHVWNVAAETSGSDYPSALTACQARADFRTSTGGCTGGAGTYCVYELENMGETSGTCKTYSNTGFNIQGALLSRASGCAEGYVDDGTGTGACTDTPPVSCEAGSDVFYSRLTLPYDNTQASFTKSNGCVYEATSVVECGVYSDGVKACKLEYTQTSFTDSEYESSNGTTLSENPPYEGPTPETSSSNDSGATTFSQSPPVTNPDGSTTQTTNEQTTNTSGSGTEIWNDDNYIYVKDSSGTTTIYDRQKTQTVNTDASIDETVVTTKSTQTPTTTTTTVNKQTTNNTTVNNNQSTTTTSTTTTNNYYDSDGNLTSSDSTTEGGSETAGDENKEGNCGAPGQPPCEVKLAGEDQLGDPGLKLQQSGIMGQFDDHITSIEEAGSEDIAEKILQSPFQLPTTGTCSPANYNINYRGQTLNFFDKFCEAYDSTLHPILQFFFYMFTAISLYFIYLRTIERT